MKLLLTLILCCEAGLAAGQAGSPCVVYATVAASDDWMVNVRQLPFKKQVLALRQRMACDAGVLGYVSSQALCLTCLSTEAQRVFRAQQAKRQQAEAADARPRGVVLFCVVDGKIFAAGSTAEFQQLVTPKSVKEISFLIGEQAAALYGSRGAQGAVHIATRRSSLSSAATP